MASSEIADLQLRNGAQFMIRAGRKQAGDLTFESGPGIPTDEIVGASTDVLRSLLETDTGKLVYVDTSVGGPGTGTIGDPYNTWDLARADIDGTTKTTIQVQDNGAVLDQEIFDAPTQAAQGSIVSIENSGSSDFTLSTGTSSQSKSVNSGAFLGGFFISCGQDTTAGGHVSISSNYGSSFSDLVLTGSSFTSTSAFVSGVLRDNSNFILYGNDNSSQGTISITASLSAPSYSNVNVGTLDFIHEIIYHNNQYIAVGYDGADGQIYTSSDASSWNLVDTEVGSKYTSVTFSGTIYVSVAESNIIKSSTDGATWTQQTSPATSGTGFDEVVYDDGVFYAIGADASIHQLVRSTDGVTWIDISSNVSLPAFSVYEIAAGNGYIIIGANDANYYISSDEGSSFSSVAGPHSLNFYLDYSNGLFILQDPPSAGGVTFFSTGAFNLTIHGACGIDFTSQTENISLYGDCINCSFDGADTRIYPGTANLLNNDISNQFIHTGFLNEAHLYQYNSGEDLIYRTPTLQIMNCDQTGTIAVESSEVESGFNFFRGGSAVALTIDSDSLDMHDNVLSSDIGTTGFTVTGTPATADDIDIWNNTIRCNSELTISGTGSNARIVDNITEGAIVNGDAATIITTGNHRGDLSGGISKASTVTDLDPFFSDTVATSLTAFQLQYAVNGFGFDSPLVNASSFSSTVTSGQPRALGAWNFDNSSVTTAYSLSKEWPLPATTNNGDAFTIEKISTFANLQTGLDGTPDVFNDPNRRQFKIRMKFATLDKEYIDFIETIESGFTDMTVELNLQLELNSTFPVSVVANGLQAAGTPTLDITTTGTVRAGMKATVGGKSYTVVYPVPLSGPTTSIVLDRVTETSIADAQAVTITDFSFSEYQLIVPNTRSFTRKNEVDETLLNGLTLEFIEKA